MTFEGYQKFKEIIGAVQIRSFKASGILPAFRESMVYQRGYEKCRQDMLAKLEEERVLQVQENMSHHFNELEKVEKNINDL